MGEVFRGDKSSQAESRSGIFQKGIKASADHSCGNEMMAGGVQMQAAPG